MKLEIEIKEIKNGWTVDDSHYGDVTFFTEWTDAAAFAKKVITRFGRDEVRWV